MRRLPLTSLPLALAACAEGDRVVGSYTLHFDKDVPGFQVLYADEVVLHLTELAVGEAGAEVEFQLGSYRFSEVSTRARAAQDLRVGGEREGSRFVFGLEDREGSDLGELEVVEGPQGTLDITLFAENASYTRAAFACTGSDQFLGAGAHAFDVEHGGERFSLWVSEPGIGKSDSDAYPDDWFATGTRHASSAPIPFLLRPHEPVGVAMVTDARVDLDLCASQPGRWTVGAWDDQLGIRVVAGATPLEVVERHTLSTGKPVSPPDWAFAPWNDAIQGADEVRRVAGVLRDNSIPSSVIWTEDWKGGEHSGLGYHLDLDWSLDTALYPDASALDAELEDQGFKWLAYFSPFVGVETDDWAQVEELVIRTADGEGAYTFNSPTFDPISVLDLSNPDAVDWAAQRMEAALSIGFDGWMADFAEWLPTDAWMDELDAFTQHNRYPLLWQALNADVLEDEDAVFFARSAWRGSQGLVPVTWAGDQMTTFEEDDGLPTVVPMGLGLGLSGVAFYSHDIAGYMSLGGQTSDQELWFRWASLGAFTPIMRTHHGAFADDNHRFDSDADTLAHYGFYAREHVRLFPYLRGLAELAEDTGRPMLLHPALLFEGYPWDAIDAWMLGSALFVAPVLQDGARSLNVELPPLPEPADEDEEPLSWYDWWTGERVESGTFTVALTEIPVFVAPGSLIPTLTEIPDTLVDRAGSGVTALDDVDGSRTLYVFGEGGSFTEADGTRYTAAGAPSEAANTDDKPVEDRTFTSGEISVAGVKLTIEGTKERLYHVVVYP